MTIALYFGHSMQLENRAADNRLASTEADQAIAGAARYFSYILATSATNGAVPDLQTYQREAVALGNASFWLIGRSADAAQLTDEPQFGLVDEASKLNLNTATVEMLSALPRMTPELAAAIIDWRDTDSDITEGGAEDETYLRLPTPYHCKNAPFESVDELRLVAGATLEILYGEDTNLNGVVDANENDGDNSAPTDNSDGRLDPGILEYLTVYSRQPNTSTNSTTNAARINLSQGAQASAAFTQLLQDRGFEAARVRQIAGLLTTTTAGAGGRGQTRGSTPTRGATATTTSYNSPLAFYIAAASRAAMTVDEFALIGNDITTTNAPFIDGLVNVNTASEAVLSCIPGIGTTNASALIAYRQQNPDKLTSVAWIVETIGAAAALQAGPYITTQSYQFTADIAATGHLGRGFKRARYVFDTTELTADGSTKILNRRDLTQLGWALGTNIRQTLLAANQTR